jgi:hypothetical protein
MPDDCGSTTDSANAAATAASAALPPSRSTAAAASLASGCAVATAPRGEAAVTARVAASRVASTRRT